MSQTIEQLGEQGLLRLVQQFCPTDVVGDDAAVLASTPGNSTVVTTDVLVDEVHFSDRTTPPHSAGWRAITANLSDLAAMGAIPTGITVGLGLPADTTVQWVQDLYQGMADCLAEFGGQIVGGDVVRSPVRTISITALGQVEPARVIVRSAAQAGDVILVTGVHGASRAGLACLLPPELSTSQAEPLIKAHQYPRPRFDISRHCRGIRVGGMDSSDGLADAVLQICRASQVGAEITQLPIAPQLTNLPQAKNWTLYGGEDFELVLCMTSESVARLTKQCPGLLEVGRITADRTVHLADPRFEPEILTLEQGFQHFSRDP